MTSRAPSVLATDVSSVTPAPVAAPQGLCSLGALAAGLGLSLLGSPALAQTAPDQAAPAAVAQTAGAESTLPTVSVKGKLERPEAKTSYQAVTTRIGKGNQALRDIPQSITVVTEKLLDDRNLDDFKDVLRATGGVTFLSGETGEEDVRLRGFSLSQAGDIYIDGLRDPSLYERDTFNQERVEILKGSASMLFGRGSTGGVVNQVSKTPFLMTQHEANVSLGSGDNLRVTGDFNFKTGDSSALRLNVLAQEADNDGITISKRGIAPSYRWNIGETNEFMVSAYHLEYDNNPIYNHPWFIVDGKIVTKLDNDAFYGLKSDYNRGSASYLTLNHTHRVRGGGELKTTLRQGRFERELWATVNRWGSGTTIDNVNPNTVITRSGKGRIAETDVTIAQSDFTKTFTALGMRHHIIAGVDYVKEDAERNNNIAGPSRPSTTVGTPNNGASIIDDRTNIPMGNFKVSSLAVYGQNLLEVTPQVKLLAGLRRERFHGDYTAINGVRTDRVQWLTSHRLGAIFQPTDWASFHVAGGSSFNTSGDTYANAPNQLDPRALRDANTPAEKSRNFEVGTKLDLLQNNLSVSLSAFRTEKYNERNNDPESAADRQLLSGKRHVKGVDIDIAGRLATGWDAFLSYTWIPKAKIDESNEPPITCRVVGGVTTCSPNNAQQRGDRPGLTPKRSASFWSTYQLTPKWRVGAGVNYRSEQNPQNRRDLTADSFTTFDAMAEYSFNEAVSIKINGTNITNRVYADGLYSGFYTPGAPRTITATMKVLF